MHCWEARRRPPSINHSHKPLQHLQKASVLVSVKGTVTMPRWLVMDLQCLWTLQETPCSFAPFLSVSRKAAKVGNSWSVTILAKKCFLSQQQCLCFPQFRTVNSVCFLSCPVPPPYKAGAPRSTNENDCDMHTSYGLLVGTREYLGGLSGPVSRPQVQGMPCGGVASNVGSSWRGVGVVQGKGALQDVGTFATNLCPRNRAVQPHFAERHILVRALNPPTIAQLPKS